MTQRESDEKFDGTSFSDIRDLIDAAERETAESWRRQGAEAVADEEEGVRARLNGWWVEVGESLDGGIGGCRILTRAGRTSVVVAYDPKTRRVRTRSGSVYVLGMPEASFAAGNRALMRRLGM